MTMGCQTSPRILHKGQLSEIRFRHFTYVGIYSSNWENANSLWYYLTYIANSSKLDKVDEVKPESRSGQLSSQS
jgi:hypothetical protein